MIETAMMGQLPSGEAVMRYRFSNQHGAYADISNYGGCVMALYVPDKQGKLEDVLLGYDALDAMQHEAGYMGFLIGRYANRIDNAAFVLNGKTYSLEKNDGENHLHGGMAGFDKKVWQANVEGDSLVLRLHSPDGEGGYPGALDVKVIYTFTENNHLKIEYEAVSDQDTILNVTNHAYFNLGGLENQSIDTHEIQILADYITEISSEACIPTGRLLPVENTPFDLREPRQIGHGFSQEKATEQMRYGMGYDHNFVLLGYDHTCRKACVVKHPESGRQMEVWTDQPGVQFYSGNHIAGKMAGKNGKPYVRRQGFCLETQHFPDSVHHASFPSCVLKKGEIFTTTTEYRFSCS